MEPAVSAEGTRSMQQRCSGMTQQKLSKMPRGRFRGISGMKMMDYLVRLGREVKIVVGPERNKAVGRLEVVAA